MKIRAISLGAGVQSTTMAFMAARGEIKPFPDCAIFADTGWEPAAVYRHLDWLESVLPFPVYRVSAGNLRRDIALQADDSKRRIASIPWFTLGPKNSLGMGRRQCTKEYKLAPIRRKVRELLGGKTPKGGCEMWIGISTDEAMRMKPSQIGYIVNRWPLIERDMSRRQCLSWMTDHGYPAPPKSACIGCPFHDDASWRKLRDESPEEFADAVAVDRLIRNGGHGMRGQQFMHRDRVPLDQVDFRTAEDRGQLVLFGNECEGMCGV